MPRKLDDEDRLIRRIEEGDRRKQDAREREPVSWRDKDRRKDRSAHASVETRPRSAVSSPNAGFGAGPGQFKADQQRKSHLAAAEALFANPGRESLERKVQASSSGDLERNVDEYIDKHGYPGTIETLARFLEHSSTEVLKETLDRIEPLLAELDATRKAQLLQTIELQSLSRRDPAARRLSNNLLRRVAKS